MRKDAKIDISQNGPFLVEGLKKLNDSDGNYIYTKEKIALCRCGASSNKPFCDGTHSRIGFSGERETDKDLYSEKSYEGKDITVHDNRTICSHSAECVNNLGSVFDVGRKPWIEPDNASAEKIKEVVKKCPSGALSYTAGGKKVVNFDRAPGITVVKNGPYNITGGIKLIIEDGLKPPASEHYSLCRCGASKNKPYCDGSHSDIGFEG